MGRRRGTAAAVGLSGRLTTRWPSPLRDPLPLLLALLAPAAPPLVGAAALLVLLVAWLGRGPSRREALVAVPALLAAAAALTAVALAPRLALPFDERWRAAAQPRYAAMWEALDAAAVNAARAVERAPDDTASRLAVHRRLAAALADAELAETTLLLVDPDGQRVAWEGPGLLQEPRPEDLRREGRDFRASFGTATLLAVAPLEEAPRPWRVVAGASFRTYGLPFSAPGWDSLRGYRWAPVAEAAQATPGALLLAVPGAPSLAVTRVAAPPPAEWVAPLRRLAWAPIALLLLALAAMRGVGLAVLAGTAVPTAHPPIGVAALAVAGVMGSGLAAGASAWTLLPMLCGPALAVAAWRLPGSARRAGVAAALGAGVALALAGAAVALQHPLGPVELASLALQPDSVALQVALLAATCGALALAAGEGPPAPAGGGRLAAASAALLIAAAVLHDRPWVAAPLLAAGAAAAALWLRRAGWRREPAALVPLVLLATLLAGAAWQGAYRLALRNAVREQLLPGLAPPATGELSAMRRELTAHFAGLDLARLRPRDPAGLDDRDLAYLLWRGSPLARRGALTALAVAAAGEPPVTFSYGLPITADGTLDQDPLRWQGLGPATWRELLVVVEAPLRRAGRPWGSVRAWLLPQPGFRLDDGPVRDLAAGLLRGGPTAGGPAVLPRELRYALYGADGAPLVSPWAQTPRLPARLASAEETVVATPNGPAWARARRERGATAVLYLPLLGAWAALERVGLQALMLLLVATALALVAATFALTRASFRDLLRRAVRSYSKRLLLVYSALLLVPLLLLDLLLARNLGERMLAEQRTAGETATRSAQQVLGEYVLSLDPGFGLETQLDDELLVWLSRVVHHEVNLYWGSSINASSRRELFSAGLLPERIPGEVHARLALLRHDLAWRTSRAGEAAYLELYAPLRVPGMGGGEPRLFLSLPLLAQQEELAAQLAELRRRSLLLTAALFLLAATIGTRLARTFTRPLQELVEGTRRIAAGDTSLALSPSEEELAALVAAIDDMALRIAQGRQRLLREKQVVERIVEHVDAGIVSLDARGWVLLRNRAAGEQLGVQVGEPLADRLAAEEGLSPVAEFVARAGGEPAEATVRLRRGDDDREYRLAWVPLPGVGEPAALLVVEDATEVLRSQRLQAWAEMARIIAHEIKNPLTPIRLSTEHMVEVYQRDPDRFAEVFERCSRNILAQVDELQQIAQEFSTYSRIPKLDPQPGDLAAAVGEVVEAYRAAPPPGVTLSFAAETPAIPARFDARLLRRAVRNLIENSLRASAGRGEVKVYLGLEDGMAAVSVADRGPGVEPELLQRIFDPYFSTHDSGTGLGLPIARRIAEEHGGSIQARNLASGGLEVTIRIPLS